MSRFIGNVSAYAYAVSKGYTGTEEEFAELMASYADVGQTAVDAAESALNSKTAAQTAATTATNKASEATTAAQTASTKASEAVGCVETATQKATESAQSASQALSYKTDAESAKTASQTAQGLAESARDTAVSAKTDAESARDDAVQAKEDAESAVASIADALDDKAPVITDTASGSIASFSDGADDLPLKSLVVDINPVQDLSHGDPSPENICPISGWTEVNVNHSDADTSNPTTITIQLGQTVYGGKLDVLTGELVVDRAMVDLGDLSWTLDGTRFKASVNGMPNKVGRTIQMACSIFKSLINGEPYDATVDNVCYGAYGIVYVHDFSYTDATTFTTAMSGVQFVYELATPITVQLTPNQINSLYGVNNIWADSGDTEAVYRADTKLFIERLTAPDSADMVADANITSGQYFMVGNSLYKATANIANGAQIIVGTNCIRKSLSEALNEINA